MSSLIFLLSFAVFLRNLYLCKTTEEIEQCFKDFAPLFVILARAWINHLSLKHFKCFLARNDWQSSLCSCWKAFWTASLRVWFILKSLEISSKSNFTFIKQYFHEINLEINESKTNFMCFSTKHQDQQYRHRQHKSHSY